ncbi:hypothetical protein Ahy_B02g058786 [Arachis hypogaea]|uniref:Aminotransferase-like plant mobile domain-containing protein n=1 Tax=Arachis hypogaea TaxID=3818 RepID=A0A445AFC6_ARAHY|nr:hypothetical protein Ahy_B02g058786 [Arachis hypogaea]
MLQCDHYLPSDSYNQIVKGHLWDTNFYHVSQIGAVQCQSALVNALIERWRLETHTFYFSVGECVVTLEDVALILGLPTNGLPVTGPTLSSYKALEAECLDQFGVAPRKADCRGSFIKLTWFRALKDHLVLVDNIQIQRWRNWDHENRPYRFRSLARFRRALDGLQEGYFVWEAYANGRIDLDVIPPDIRQHSAIWNATVLLISFECIEWHASNRLRRQFGLTQSVHHQERDLGEAHDEVLTGPKNQD